LLESLFENKEQIVQKIRDNFFFVGCSSNY